MMREEREREKGNEERGRIPKGWKKVKKGLDCCQESS